MKDSTWDTTDLSGITGWFSSVGDMARLGLLLLHGGMWNGERLLDARWAYKMTHPSFEDGNTAYGYLTWLNARNNWHLAGLEDFTFGAIGPEQQTRPLIACAPAAIHAMYPHAPSEAPDCNYLPPATCAQEHDVGAWEANGLGGQLIMGHPGLDLVIVTRNFGDATGEGLITMGSALWEALVPAIVAEDPRFRGDRAGFCDAYARGSYAPDVLPEL
jgi:CubicO group peptidase (beta-lactamase class C family)